MPFDASNYFPLVEPEDPPLPLDLHLPCESPSTIFKTPAPKSGPYCVRDPSSTSLAPSTLINLDNHNALDRCKKPQVTKASYDGIPRRTNLLEKLHQNGMNQPKAPKTPVPSHLRPETLSSYYGPLIPSHLLPPDHPPKLPKKRRKFRARQAATTIASGGKSDISHPQDDVDSPTRSSSTSPPAPDLGIAMHAPAPMRIHYLANGPYPTGTVAPPRYLQSASLVSDAGHSGVERGWSTAPSILTGPMARPPSPPPSSFAHHLREPSIPKRLKNRRTGPDRASLRNEPPIPQRRIFLVPRPAALQPPASTSTTVQHINHAIFPPSKLSRHCDVLPLASAADDLQSTSNPSVRDACSRPSSTSIAPSPAIDEDDSILDRFVVDSAIAYTPAILNLESSDQDIAAKARNLCSSFLDVFRDLKRYVRFLEYRGNDAQRLIDSMQSLLDDGLVEPQFRVILIVALSRLARKSELYPSRYKLHGVTRLPGTFAEGHFGDIQKGRFDGRVVSIKVPRFPTREVPDLRSYRRALSREIVPWAQICHPNVLPFYGIILLDDECDRFGIVSPFLENGNVIDFLEVNPAADRRSLIHGVASGMRHLHDCGIVHGDIKGRNILVTDSEPPRAVLADFGFATIIDASGLKSPQLSSNAVEGGTPRFEAPELFNPNIPYRRTVASDVYAFSMASYEILSGDIPFPNKRDVHVMVMVAEGKRPNRPIGELYLNRGLDDSMWTLMQDCWAQDSNSRPSSRHILERLSIGPGLGVDGGDWGNLAPSWFLKNHDPQISVPQTDY